MIMGRKGSKRKHSADPLPSDVVLGKLVQCSTKTGMVAALSSSGKAGWLNEDVVELVASDSKIRRGLRNAQIKHGEATTPYGQVVQSISTGITGLASWQICHPMALMWYLSTISSFFADLFSPFADGVALRVVIYIDEICPGNPLRPDKARTLQAIYWCIADWPQWLLQRTAIWPAFGTIRSTLVEKLPGRVSQLMNMILHVFWPEHGQSMTRGVTLVMKHKTPRIITACFAGFLADEKAHNQGVGTKGASGTFLG